MASLLLEWLASYGHGSASIECRTGREMEMKPILEDHDRNRMHCMPKGVLLCKI